MFDTKYDEKMALTGWYEVGRQEFIGEAVTKMLNTKMSAELIARVTGWTVGEIFKFALENDVLKNIFEVEQDISQEIVTRRNAGREGAIQRIIFDMLKADMPIEFIISVTGCLRVEIFRLAKDYGILEKIFPSAYKEALASLDAKRKAGDDIKPCYEYAFIEGFMQGRSHLIKRLLADEIPIDIVAIAMGWDVEEILMVVAIVNENWGVDEDV